jgi:hypothetical protein
MDAEVPLPIDIFSGPLIPRAVEVEDTPLESVRCSCAIDETETVHCPAAAPDPAEGTMEASEDVAVMEPKLSAVDRATAALFKEDRVLEKLEIVAWAFCT